MNSPTAQAAGSDRVRQIGDGTRPQAGETAPDVLLTLADGSSAGVTRPLSAWRGAPLVLYFYPRDATPGCTSEAKDFSQAKADFARYGARILGVSRDDLASHARFIARQGLTIDLVSDEDGSVCQAFGIWVEKTLYGRKFMGIERATFLIDPQGIVLRVWPRVKVRGHAEAVLKALDEWSRSEDSEDSGGGFGEKK